MKRIKFSMSIILLACFSIFHSCSEDASLNSITEEFRGGNNGNNNNNNQGNPPENGGQLVNSNQLLYEWTNKFLELDRYAAGMRPNATARALAYINLATYETAVPAMRDKRSMARTLQGLEIRSERKERNVDYRTSLNTCYAKVLNHFLINLPADKRTLIGQFQQTKEQILEQGLSERIIEDSKDWGDYIAQQVIKYALSDSEAESQILEPQPSSYEPPTGAGFWTYSADPERALFPYWKSVRTFVVSPDETTTITPISYSEQAGSEYFDQMKEVYEINNTAKAEDNEDLWIAEFWSDDVEGLMFSPPARQFSIANQLIKQKDLSLEESLALYLKLGFALNDAAVSTWKYKYEHMVMRPNVYIHEHIDPDYQTNLFRLIYWPNPSFPGYPSGHSCFASAAGGLFIDVFGNEVDFVDQSHDDRTEFRGAARSFSSFEELAEENAFSRIPLGVHIRMDCTEGLRLGYEISAGINKLDLQRNPQ